MARILQSVSAVAAAARQMWEEKTSSTGGTYHLRMMGSVLFNSTQGEVGSSDVPFNTKASPSTAVLGHIVADASTAVIGHIVADASTAIIGGLAASTAQIGVVSGRTRVVEATLTRTTDVTPYTAGDAVTGSTSAPACLTFAGMARAAGGSGVILNVIAIDKTAQATKPTFELHLYDAPPTANNDNAAFAVASSDADNELPGSPISLATWTVGNTSTSATGNCVCSVRGVNIPYQCGTTLSDLYGLVCERGGYTPIPSEAFVFRLGNSQD